MIRRYAELPEYMKTFLKDWLKEDDTSLEEFVTEKLGALGDKSIIETFNEKNGEDTVINYLNETVGHIGGPYLIKKPKK